VSPRPLVLVPGLTVGDYLLWNWSLNGNHDVLALIAGLTLPPLAVASLWLLALGLAGLIATVLERSRTRARGAGSRAPGVHGRRGVRTRTRRQATSEIEASQAASAQAGSESRKLAA
jgi:hypothetical protein